MSTFHFTVVVECDTMEQAEQVASERINYDEDYGFPYRLYVRGDGVEQP